MKRDDPIVIHRARTVRRAQKSVFTENFSARQDERITAEVCLTIFVTGVGSQGGVL